MKLMTVIGARPQFIKAATVSRLISDIPTIEEQIIHTGQHFDENMSDVFFSELEIPKPRRKLNINGMLHGDMTGKMMSEIESSCVELKPDVLMVYGDTNSTIAGALVAAKLHIPVVHVEAGLRSFNMKMPEEINRIVTDRVSSLLFCPTQAAIDNLYKEGFAGFDSEIILAGDVMYDSAIYFKSKAKVPTSICKSKLESEFILGTVHRAENVDNQDRLRECIAGLNALQRKFEVIVPMHPRTAKAIERCGFEINFTAVPPVSYLEMVYLLQHCRMVVSDSGGVQKEAYFFNKKCLTLRDETEWVELIGLGSVRLVECDRDMIVSECESLMNTTNTIDPELYGGGFAANTIVKKLSELD